MLGMAVGGVDHDEIDAGIDQQFGTREALVADRGRAAATRSRPRSSLQAFGLVTAFFDVLHGDEPDAAIAVIDDEQFFDAVGVEEPLGFLLTDALAHRDQVFLGHQLRHALLRVGREPHVPVGEDADEFSGRRGRAALHHRNAGNVIALHQFQGVGELGLRVDGERVHHHAGFEFLDLAHLGRLVRRLEVAVQNAEATGLRHGDRHGGFGHRVHRGGDDRDIQRNLAGDPGADIDLGGQNIRQTRLQQHVVAT